MATGIILLMYCAKTPYFGENFWAINKDFYIFFYISCNSEKLSRNGFIVPMVSCKLMIEYPPGISDFLRLTLQTQRR